MKSLQGFLYIHLEQLKPFIIQDIYYNYKKNDKYRQKVKICTKKLARKRCPSQLNIKLFTKNIKNHFFFKWLNCESDDAHYCLKKQNPTIKPNIQKSRTF